MTNPISVLLIVGSAVVGPIERQPISVDQGAVNECQSKLPTSYGCAYGDSAESCSERIYRLREQACRPQATVYESLPQLCERAMREIGAEQSDDKKRWYIDAGMLPSPPDRFGTASPPQFRDLVPVRCIPTPTGYRK